MSVSKHLREEYDRRIHRVFSYIDENIARQISIKELATEASFSEFHFHRLFKATFGEPLGVYLTRRRVEIAAIRLLAQPKLSVLEVAIDVGFGSSEAFSRAFKLRYQQTPSAWRRNHANSKISQFNSKTDQEIGTEIGYDSLMQSNTAPFERKVTLVERPATYVQYLRYQGPLGTAVGKFWHEVAYPWIAENGMIGLPRYGICHDDPIAVEPEKCRYDACVEVDPETPCNSIARDTIIPGGLYASTEFLGKSSEIIAVWDQILRSWLPNSGYQLDARPFLEYYSKEHQYDEATNRFECSILVPITKLFK